MVTVYTKSVGTTSRDYSTITLAEADVVNIGTSGDLVSNVEAIVFELYADSTFNEHVVVNHGGMTVDVTHNITYKAATGQQHDGTYGSGILLEPSTSGHAFSIEADHVHFQGLEVAPGSAASDECFRVTSGVLGLRVDCCILRPYTLGSTPSDQDGVYAGNYSVGSATYPITVTNCLLVGFTRAGLHAQDYSGNTHACYWDSICNTFIGGVFGFGYRSSGSSSTLDVHIVDCVTADHSSGAWKATGATSGTITTTGSANNLGEDTTTPFPSQTTGTLTDSLTPGAGSWIITEDATGSWDLQTPLLVDDADNDALLFGVGPSSNSLVPDHDGVGNSRSGTTTDVGWHNKSGEASGNTGTGASTLGAASSGATGSLTITGTGASTLGAVSSSATGALEITGTGASEAAAATSSATGGLQFTGTAASTLGSASSASSGSLSITGTAASELAAPASAATGTLTITGTGASELGPATSAATGGLQFTGVGTSTLGAASSTATGSLTITGSASSKVAAAESAATGSLTVTGIGASEAAAATRDAIGTYGTLITGSGSSTLGAAGASATGTLEITGTAASELAAPASAATGTLTITGTGASEAAAATSAATGTYGTLITGSSASTLGAPGSAATGTLTINGSGASTLGAVSSAATGTVSSSTITGTGASTVGAAASAATGSLTITGTAASTLAPPTSTATGGVTNSGAAASTLGAMTSAATGNNAAASAVFGYRVTHDLLVQAISFAASELPAGNLDYIVRQNGAATTALITQTTAQTNGQLSGLAVEFDAGDIIGCRGSDTVPAPVVVCVVARRRITP